MCRIISVLFSFIFCFCSIKCESQRGEYLFHHLRVLDGLSQATNAYVFKDSRGFVWISSLSGLNRFDGTHVRVYTNDKSDPSTLLGANVHSPFFEDHQKNLWFSTFEALHKYNWDHDCFDYYQLYTPDGNPRVGYYVFYQDPSHHLWFLLENEFVYTFHIPTGTFVYKGEVNKNTIRCFVAADNTGHISKILSRGRDWSGIEVIQIKDQQEWEDRYNLPTRADLSNTKLRKILFEADTVAWILTTHYLIHYTFETQDEKVISLTDGEDMARLSDSILLIGTNSNGLLNFNTRQMRFVSNQSRNPDDQRSLQQNNVTYLHKDVDQNIWVSTEGVGISYAHPEKRKFQTTYFPEDLQHETKIIPIYIDEKSLDQITCFTESEGILDIDYSTSPPKFHKRYFSESLSPPSIHKVSKDQDGKYWISTWSGIFRYDPTKGNSLRVSGDSLIAYSFQPLKDGRVLFTTSNNGLYEAHTHINGQFSVNRINAVPHDMSYDPVLLDHKGRIWVNGDIQQFFVFDSSSFDSITTIPFAGFCYAWELSKDSSTIWAASSTGLYEIDANTLQVRFIYSKDTGLPAVGLSNMLMDQSGKLWLAHFNGIISFDPRTRSFRSFTDEDGLPSLEFTQAGCVLENGELCFGAIGALTHFYPDQVSDIQVKAVPQITEILIYDRPPQQTPVCEITGATHITEIQKLCFPYKNNTLSFVINALEYSAPKYNKVRYQMIGLDVNPLEVHSGSRIRYPNLQPGTYTLVLHALNSDGVTNPKTRKLIIVIDPPFYRTWWFRILVVVFVISIVAYIIYLRFSKKLELQKVRLKLYENLHDDVGSRLTAIVLSAEDLERNDDISHPKLTNISQIARSIVGNMRRLVWAIDPENDRMNSILQKINHDKSQVLDDSIDFQIEIENHLKNFIIPGEVRYQMSSICNEAFNNISKYAQASKVWVRVARENGFIKMVVEDNGIGFDPAGKSKNALTGAGYGLANMQRRASRVGGKLVIDSKPGKGTRVEFTFPLKS